MTTPTAWVREWAVQAAILDDEPALRMMHEHNIERGRADAAAAGLELIGEPDIQTRPLVWVEHWAEHGTYCSVEVARAAGVTDPPRWIEYLATWPCRPLETR